MKVKDFKEKAFNWCPLDLNEDLEIRFFVDKRGDTIFGSFKKGTEQAHGLVRKLTFLGLLLETQFKDGKKHGSEREINYKGYHSVGYNKDDKRVGEWVAYD